MSVRKPKPKFGFDAEDHFGPDIHPCMLWWDGPEAPELKPHGQRAYVIPAQGAEVREGPYGTMRWVDGQAHSGSGLPDLGLTKEQKAACYAYAPNMRAPLLEVRHGPTMEETAPVVK